jgi:hypothetical protein
VRQIRRGGSEETSFGFETDIPMSGSPKSQACWKSGEALCNQKGAPQQTQNADPEGHRFSVSVKFLNSGLKCFADDLRELHYELVEEAL